MTINQGIFGLIGENGASKTTLLKTISTIMSVDEECVKMLRGEYLDIYLDRNIQNILSCLDYN